MATKKVKKFGRGGDILTGVGAALIGKHLYDKYMSKDDSKTDNRGSGLSYPKPKLSDEVDAAQESSRKKDVKKSETPIQDTDERFNSANRASKGQPEMGDATNDDIVVKKAKPVATVVQPVKRANSSANKVLDKPADVGAATKKISSAIVDRTSANRDAASNKISSAIIDRTSAERDAATKKISDAAETMKGRKIPTIAEQTATATQKIKDAAAKMKAAKEANANKPSKPYPEKEAAKNKEALARVKKPGEVTFLTEERKDKAKKAYYAGFKRKEADKPTKEEVEATRRRFAGTSFRANEAQYGNKKGGVIKKMASGGSVSSASKRADGCAIRGKTRA